MRYLIGMIFFAVTLMATEIHWYDDYNEAIEVAKKEHKLVYVFISSSHCGWCHKFEKKILQNENVKKELKKEFVAVHLINDLDDIPQKFKTAPVPRHYFTDANKDILYDSLGYREVDTFLAFMGYAEEQSNTKGKK
jgi:thioredoxin-related protein